MRRSVIASALVLFSLVPACASSHAEPAASPAAPKTVTVANEAPAKLDAAAIRTSVDRAVALVDAQKLDEGIAILEATLRVAPNDPLVVYETAFAYSTKGDKASAIALLEKNLDMPNGNELFYQLLGNCFDDAGSSTKARAIYERGLVRFPNAGRLYHEIGILEAKAGDNVAAANTFAQGTEVEPMYKTNYYGLTSLLGGSAHRLRTALYGEVVLNLGSDDPRDKDVRAAIWEAYTGAFQFTKDGMSVSLVPSNIVDASKPAELPFSMNYELTMALGVTQSMSASAPPKAAQPTSKTSHGKRKGKKAPAQPAPDPTGKVLGFEEIHAARAFVAQRYAEKHFAGTAASPLLAWQASMIRAGVFDAYDRWLFDRPEASIASYCKANAQSCKALQEWVHDHPLKTDASTPFVPFDKLR